MIYVLLFWEFFKVGLFAIGGGLVTVPFLFDMSDTYSWFSHEELVNMIAISESTPGPLGVNMATYVGYNTAGILGGIVAVFGLVLPSVLVIVFLASLLFKYKNNPYLQKAFYVVRPVVVALILFATLKLFELAVVDKMSAVLCAAFLGAMFWFRLHPIVYILIGAVVGIFLKL